MPLPKPCILCKSDEDGVHFKLSQDRREAYVHAECYDRAAMEERKPDRN